MWWKIGYVGNKKAQPILVSGLRALEYRGYDSAGIYTTLSGRVRSLGDIDALEKRLSKKDDSTAGVAHTRWATHGQPAEDNAHPHTDKAEKIYLVHNGIIENYQDLKQALIKDGVRFTSETDTEVLTQLIGKYYKGNIAEAVQKALKEVRGAYGIAVMSHDDPAKIVVAKMGSPVVIGIGNGAHFVASDTSALVAYTKRIIYLEDGDMAVLTPMAYTITNNSQKQERIPETITDSVAVIQKEGYEHFMLKEIEEGPQVVRDTLRGRLMKDTAKLGGLEQVALECAAMTRLTIVGCGSAYLAGYVGKYLIEAYAGVPTTAVIASEYRYGALLPEVDSVVLAITQSGETADTLAAIRAAKEAHLLTLGVVNVVGSTIARETDAGVYNHIGPEVAVASTKAFISELVILVLVALFLGRQRTMSKREGAAIVEALEQLPHHMERVLKEKDTIKKLAKKYAKYEHMMFIGRGTHMPIAYEGALKLKEVSYIHAEAYPAGELKHGPIALLEKGFPVLGLLPKDALYEKMYSNLEEVKARRAPLVVVATIGDRKAAEVADDVIKVPKTHDVVQPIVMAVALHLFAYYAGVARGHNVDRPRNLAKSVTVE